MRKPLALCLLLAALWAVDSWTPSADAAGLICSFQACIGTGSYPCPGTKHGHCVNGACSL